MTTAPSEITPPSSSSENERPNEKDDHALIFHHNAALPITEWQKLSEHAPGVTFSIARTEDEYRSIILTEYFDVIIFCWPAEDLVKSMLLPELRFSNHTPGILVLSNPSDPITVTTIYNAGCDRLVIQDGNWIAELGQAVRALIRLKKGEQAYELTRARLTEMNHMLEEKNRRLDEFSMTIAHDIRGPLGGISMKLEYVLDTYEEQLPGRAKDLMRKAFDSSQRLTDVVQAMYEYARLGSKAAKMNMLSLSKLVQNVVSDLEFDPALDISIGLGELPEVWGNPELLSRVFINLISNAVKYNDKKQIVINIGFDRDEKRTLARYANIFISDNGPGIPEQDLQGLFNMFSRGTQVASQSRGAQADGLGVGLAVVQRIAELHYGNVSVSSEKGQGTRFDLLLPLERVDIIGQ